MARARDDFALVIFAVTDHDDGPAHRMVAPVLAQLFAAGAIDGVIHRGAPAVVQIPHSGFQQVNVVGELLRDLAVSAETHDKSFVEIRPQGVLQEADRGFLFEIEAAVHRAAGIHQQSQLQRQISFAPEIHNRLRRLVVVQDGEIALVQIAHELAMVVRRNEQHIDLIHPLLDGKDGIRGISPGCGRIGRGYVEAGDATNGVWARSGNPADRTTRATIHRHHFV